MSNALPAGQRMQPAVYGTSITVFVVLAVGVVVPVGNPVGVMSILVVLLVLATYFAV